MILAVVAVITAAATVMTTTASEGFPKEAWAADEGEQGGGRGGGGAVKALGWAAVGAGALGTGSLVAYKMSRKAMLAIAGSGGGITRSLTMAYKPALNFHMAMNLIGYCAGMAHGIMLSRAADGISISLALVMTVLVASGVLMRLTSSRMRLFNIQLHGQVFLVALLVLLVVLHIATADD
ncbi:hypothetical protein NVIE_006390 [Nitrososphaera viennensis EN76]|uniref:Uncharacterized protein n=3 Tax=Nitrososphaera viennensis TaxID=1034015 RepID=A0A060HDR9_9ARCH|nr:hypothetical protein NVIE_006390 [Nitrososphaera viennensis EN76]